MKIIDFFDTKEYTDELINRFNNGGIIWLIERTDTNEFYAGPIGPSIHTFGKGCNKRQCKWVRSITQTVVFYGFLSYEDAEQYQFTREGIEYGLFKLWVWCRPN